ncbi:hypothetical protein [Sorangium cellulosum]|uniref:Uncharacterized protein n=1 Tax=Sorangium cellulosum TaxID=56 RepID=A0A150QL33_SORCE|nr:hypothetical protein [Sorangium cellulosum]KYF68697.1 hypothetical protein BE15_30865 [Sorangium cellulosum]
MKWAELHLPYFKQGDDLAHWLRKTRQPVAALEAHAEQLDWSAARLRQVKEAIVGQKVQIDADTHVICISGPDGLIDGMVRSGLLEFTSDDDADDEPDDGGWNEIF